MGEFLAMSGVIGGNKGRVESALRSFAESRDGQFTPQQGTTEDENILVVAEGSGGTTVMYPGGFPGWDDASAFLSRELDAPVFSFHIHDGDLWMLILYVGGDPVTQFIPLPRYWDDNPPPDEIADWHGDAREIAQHVPGLRPESIERYFVEWDLDDEAPGSAYPDDEFPYHDCWQLCDFMKRVGLSYPIDSGGRITGTTFRFQVRDPN